MNDVLMQAVRSYRNGKTAEVLQFCVDGVWGVPYTVPSTTVKAMEHVGDQYRALGAEKMRHIRRARLRKGTETLQDVAVETVLPDQRQSVLILASGQAIHVRYLRDATLSALEGRLGLHTGEP